MTWVVQRQDAIAAPKEDRTLDCRIDYCIESWYCAKNLREAYLSGIRWPIDPFRTNRTVCDNLSLRLVSQSPTCRFRLPPSLTIASDLQPSVQFGDIRTVVARRLQRASRRTLHCALNLGV